MALTAGHGKASLKLKYGGLPSWLPKSTFNPNEVLQASLRKPVLAIQGNTVSINLAGGHVLAELVGPTVPEDGKFPVPRTSPATFILTLSTPRAWSRSARARSRSWTSAAQFATRRSRLSAAERCRRGFLQARRCR
ncbi:MAG: hypothetical protein ACLP1Q_19085 [Solirubrobacteraceae bacterium]